MVFRIDEGIEVGAIENQTVHIQLAGRYQTLSEIGFELVWRDGKWDKQNRTSSGLCLSGLTCQDRSQKQSSFLLKRKIQLEENTASRL